MVEADVRDGGSSSGYRSFKYVMIGQLSNIFEVSMDDSSNSWD
jgi:hypothetical protein